MTEKERSLLAGCIRGDKASWDAFVQQYSALVYHTIRKTFVTYQAEPNTELVEDLFQEFFLAIVRDDFKKLRQFRGEKGCSLPSWLRLIAARLTIDALRKSDCLATDVSCETLQDNDPAEDLRGEEESQKLSRSLETLSPKDRLLLELLFLRNLPPQSVAKILKTSVSAVYTQKSRIVSKLREILS